MTGQFLSVDVETYEYNEEKKGYVPVLDARKFYLGVVYHEEGTSIHFTQPEDMWKYIEGVIEKNSARKLNTYIYAHNGSYDFSSYAQNHLFDVTHVLWKPFLAISKNGKGYYLDTMSFYQRMKLEDIGNMLGYPKMTLPELVQKPEELIEYCTRDCEITLKAVLELKEALNKLGFNPKKLLTAGTLAITSWQTYIKKHNQHYGILHKGKIHRSTNWRKARYALRGGRVEAFQKGVFGDCTMIDVNSMYPYVMSTMRFPDLEQPFYIEAPDKKDWATILTLIGVAEATVETPSEGIGYLPVYCESKQQYLVENRTLTGRWTLLELARAQQEGYTITDIHWVECYTDAETNPFSDYINYLYNLRKQSPPFLAHAIKLIMNNLYGKFSQYKLSKELALVKREDYEPENGEIIGEYGIHYVVEKETGEMIRNFTNPLISTLITAQARDILYEGLGRIPKEDLLYCDTDSIIYKGNHDHLFTIGKGMGEWSIKKKGIAVIRKEKTYSIGDEVHMSGLNKGLQTNDTLHSDQTEQPFMLSLRAALQAGDPTLTGSFQTRLFTFQEEEPKNLPDTIDEREHYTH